MNKFNLLLSTDVYKFDHAAQYPKGTTKIYSYFCARKPDAEYGNETLFFGLQYYLEKYLSKPVTLEDVEEFKEISSSILGPSAIDYERYYQLAELGYLPIEIKAVEEGELVPVRNALFTITNTHPEYFWLVNFIETLLLKVWYPTTVATISHAYKQLCRAYALQTCDNEGHLPFQIHDFGFRAVSSDESGHIGGSAHLLNFLGSDTTGGVKMLRDYYSGTYPIALSVPASEHSVMCAWSPDNDDRAAIRNMLAQYPTGIVSIVSDTYNIWNAVDYFCNEMKPTVLARDGKVVVRPDSGDPETLIPEIIERLWSAYSGTYNSKGYKVLNDKIGVIYGDAIYFERARRIFETLKKNGFASSNVVFGIGGILLQCATRDTFGFSLKATYCEVDGESRAIMKQPIGDTVKKSHKGLLKLAKSPMGTYHTIENVDATAEGEGYLTTVYKDGKVTKKITLDQLRNKQIVI
jgi:nicotinamide phosphoribosyltransferase